LVLVEVKSGSIFSTSVCMSQVTHVIKVGNFEQMNLFCFLIPRNMYALLVALSREVSCQRTHTK